MGTWNVDLELNFNRDVKSIETEDCEGQVARLKLLRNTCKEIMDKSNVLKDKSGKIYADFSADKEYYEEVLNDFEDLYYLIDGDDEIVEDYYKDRNSILDYGFETSTELVNDRLSSFYNLCDRYYIWCGV